MIDMEYQTQTQILQIDPQAIDPAKIAQAAAIIQAGGLVAFPTETVYGLGANALDSAAVDRIFAAKQRPASDPIIVHIAALEALPALVLDVPQLAYDLAAQFWPGALTLILPRHPDLPPNLSSNLPSVAIRMPSHPIAQALIQAAERPIAAPSANTFTRPSATTAAHVLQDLNGRVDLVLDGGAVSIGIESTVLDLTTNPPTVLRPGGVLLEDLRAVLPDVVLAPRYLQSEDQASASPGMLIKHYAPRAELIVLSGDRERVLGEMAARIKTYQTEGRTIGLLLSAEDAAYFQNRGFRGLEVVSLGDDMAQIGLGLFAGLRYLDGRGVEVILTRTVEQSGLGLAIWDRLLRAAEGRIIEV